MYLPTLKVAFKFYKKVFFWFFLFFFLSFCGQSPFGNHATRSVVKVPALVPATVVPTVIVAVVVVVALVVVLRALVRVRGLIVADVVLTRVGPDTRDADLIRLVSGTSDELNLGESVGDSDSDSPILCVSVNRRRVALNGSRGLRDDGVGRGVDRGGGRVGLGREERLQIRLSLRAGTAVSHAGEPTDAHRATHQLLVVGAECGEDVREGRAELLVQDVKDGRGGSRERGHVVQRLVGECTRYLGTFPFKFSKKGFFFWFFVSSFVLFFCLVCFL
jgi:hypothetical protein